MAMNSEIKFDNFEFQEGSLLFDVRYYERPECLEVVYRDPSTNQLEVSYRKPMIDIWFVKKEFRTFEYQISQIETDKCYPVFCKPSQVSKVIAENCGGEWAEYYERYKSEIRPNIMKKHMCECPYVFKADFMPDVYFRLRWLKKFGLECDVSQVSYSLMDIETDVLDRNIDMKNIHAAPQPINAITLILPEQKICAVHMLGPRSESQIHPKFHGLLKKQTVEYNWIKEHQSEFTRMIVEDDKENAIYLKGYDIRLYMFDYNDEINMIKTVFDYINKYRPMFCMSWNAKFDHNYLYERIKYLGYDPCAIIIPPQFKTNKLYYREDPSPKVVIKTATDWWFTSTYTVYICQMRLFAAIRKSQKEKRSYGLTDVGYDTAKIVKLSDTKTGSFREFAYTDYIKFIMYNIRDVVVQLVIEQTNSDTKSLVSRSYMFATQFSKCFKETHIVRNMREYFFEESNYVQACTLLIEPGIDTAFPGAFVAPTENNAPTGYILNGKRINNIIYGALDADATAYYPSSKMLCNMDPMSLIYKCRINNDVFRSGRCINRSFNQEYIWYDNKTPPRPHEVDMAGPINNSFKNKNYGSLLYNWHNAASKTDYFKYIDENLSITD